MAACTASIASARIALADRVLRAPVTGTLERKFYEAGEVAGSGAPVLASEAASSAPDFASEIPASALLPRDDMDDRHSLESYKRLCQRARDRGFHTAWRRRRHDGPRTRRSARSASESGRWGRDRPQSSVVIVVADGKSRGCSPARKPEELLAEAYELMSGLARDLAGPGASFAELEQAMEAVRGLVMEQFRALPRATVRDGAEGAAKATKATKATKARRKGR